jgi:hypothetical protein
MELSPHTQHRPFCRCIKWLRGSPAGTRWSGIREPSLLDIIGHMPRVGEFCASNIARLLLAVVIVVALVAALGVWLFHSPGHGTSIEQPTHATEPLK